MSNFMQKQNERESRLRALAGLLEFTVEKTGDRFMLTRTADVSPPVREDRLTIDQAEHLLEIWKLRGGG